MDLNKIDLTSPFPAVGYDQWKQQAEAELKGAPFDKKLVGQTFEGIPIQPLYTRQHWDHSTDPSGFPGFPPLTRANTPLGRALDGWQIRQEHTLPDPAEANQAILDDLEHGVHSIHLRLDDASSAGLDADDPEALSLSGQNGVMAYTLADLARTLEAVRLDLAPVSIDAGANFLASAALLTLLAEARKIPPDSLQLAFNADPIGTLVREGRLNTPPDQALAQMADLASWTSHNLPRSRAIQVGTNPYHHAGASSTQDLAFALATAVEYLRALSLAGLSIHDAAGQLVFSLSIGTHFFKAIAKIRALRLLWTKVVLASGGSELTAASIQIRVRTSRRVLTAFDPWVNLLRNTVCCFAGAVAGADIITTTPMDAAIGQSTDFSRRLARNTQIILQEESYLNRVIDPAGGSFFLETLTSQLAEKSWDLFRQVEAQGGMLAAVQSGWIAQQIQSVEKAREKDLATRKQVITGISEHPNIHEEPLKRPPSDPRQLRAEAANRLISWRKDHNPEPALQSLAAVAANSSRSPGELTAATLAAARAGATIGQLSQALSPPGSLPARIDPLPVLPYAAAYEELRAASELHLERTGSRPRVFLANLGTPAEFIPRSTFALNFFEAGGFEEVNNDGFTDPSAVAAAFQASQARIAVLCSTDAIYDKLAIPVAQLLKANGARSVILAGNPGEAEARYRAAGIDRFIYIRCDVLGTLRDLLREEGALQ